MEEDKIRQKVVYWPNGSIRREAWYKGSWLHRENGPAWIEYTEDGRIIEERWYKNNKLDRDDGPAIIKYYPNGRKKLEVWYKGNFLHREDGPAWIEYDINDNIIEKRYYLKDGKIPEELFMKYKGINDIIKEQRMKRRISL
ncbi:hypothetical protein SAMN04244560_01013 [Thermoanaerobacter thermohydrosulfuricus]|uniref:MORN repeat variant n=1 Tax=Thermoanaerobacter thermohydrosulfuricus TaxID=1516 RepID=A0A1G7MRR0_THETY|nr:hypothetical protein [Thermoanaerobacter thermohydrosulfuricus]SDF64528.1 hypothetical protein SAMN04244560_01013 [Thermoanaerobacter thermohydrosulfuricus]